MHSFNEEFYNRSTRHVNKHFDAHVPTEFFWRLYTNEVDHIHPTEVRKRFFYTAIAYALSSQAARMLLRIVDRFGFIEASDLMLIKILDLADDCFTTYPLLVGFPPKTKHEVIFDDSDIASNLVVIAGAPPYPKRDPWNLRLLND